MSDNQVIPDAAVEAAAKVLYRELGGLIAPHVARAALEAAAPHMLSHEREETRLAHVDAVVNAETVGKLQAKLDAIERHIDPTGWHGGEQPRQLWAIQKILDGE